MSNMALVEIIAGLVALNPRRYKHLSAPLLISKGNSCLLYMMFYLKTGKTPYLIGSLVDMAPFVTILPAYLKAI